MVVGLMYLINSDTVLSQKKVQKTNVFLFCQHSAAKEKYILSKGLFIKLGYYRRNFVCCL